MAKSIMIQGTASGVGKTVLTMALCRILKQDGHRVAPFKSLNITANTTLIKDKSEIAVSQALQAYAAGIVPEAAMNPVLLKPVSGGKQIILNWYSLGYINNLDNNPAIKKELLPVIMNAYESLSQKYDIIVIEGAGSPVELNLNKDDIVNMGIAKQAKSPVLLVSDIDRGGVFASLYGTLNLFDASEIKYVKAVIVNRFKGDISFFKEGVDIIEKITGLPVAGVVPHIPFYVPEEDSLRNTASLSFSSNMDLDVEFDVVADNVRKSLNMELIYKIIDEGI